MGQRLAGADSKLDTSKTMSEIQGDGSSSLSDETESILDPEEQKQRDLENNYKKRTFVLPSCSQWFDLDNIHELEIQSLPEYFNQKHPHKNPQSYMV
jgi:hypothetical protein